MSTIGQILAAARDRAGYSIQELSARTYIRETVLEGIENDDFGPCGGDFYARGHIKAVCRELGVASAELIERFDAEYASGSPSPLMGGDAIRPVRPDRSRTGQGAGGANDPAEGEGTDAGGSDAGRGDGGKTKNRDRRRPGGVLRPFRGPAAGGPPDPAGGGPKGAPPTDEGVVVTGTGPPGAPPNDAPSADSSADRSAGPTTAPTSDSEAPEGERPSAAQRPDPPAGEGGRAAAGEAPTTGRGAPKGRSRQAPRAAGTPRAPENPRDAAGASGADGIHETPAPRETGGPRWGGLWEAREPGEADGAPRARRDRQEKREKRPVPRPPVGPREDEFDDELDDAPWRRRWRTTGPTGPTGAGAAGADTADTADAADTGAPADEPAGAAAAATAMGAARGAGGGQAGEGAVDGEHADDASPASSSAAPAPVAVLADRARRHWPVAVVLCLAAAALIAGVQAWPDGGGDRAAGSAVAEKADPGAQADVQKEKARREAATTAQPAMSTTVRNAKRPEEVRVRLYALRRTWLSVTDGDGSRVFAGVVKKGRTRVWSDKEELRLHLGNAGGVHLEVNGAKEGIPGGRGQVKYVTFSADDLAE